MTDWQGAFLAAVWLACASMLRPSVRSKQSMLPQGVLLWTIAYTLTWPPVYGAVDTALGGQNLTNLLYRLFMIAGLGCLEVMLLRVSRGINPRVELRVAATTVALFAVQCALFRPGLWLRSSVYLIDYGGQLPREAFWNVLPLCVAFFAIHAVITVRVGWRGHSVLATRWGIMLIAIASGSDLVWAAWNLLSSTVRLTGTPSFFLTTTGDPIGTAILGISALLTGSGVAVASSDQLLIQARMRLLLLRSWPMRRRSARALSTLPTSSGAAVASALLTWEPEYLLYRRWVELVDCGRTGALTPSRRQQYLIDSIEQTLGTAETPSSPGLLGGLLGGR